MRRVNPLYLLASLLAMATIVFAFATVGAAPTSSGRTGSVFAVAVGFLYLVLSGRRLGPPVPLDPRPARSSLEYIRGFAGLVRRSGHGEIARRRLRRDLRGGLARALGLDPGMPFDRILATLAAADRQRAAEARAVDDALGGRLREDQLLRTVAQIERLVKR